MKLHIFSIYFVMVLTSFYLKVEVDGAGSSIECPICQNTISEDIYALPCAHTYCRVCILPWLQSNDTCPVCRTRVIVNRGIAALSGASIGERNRHRPSIRIAALSGASIGERNRHRPSIRIAALSGASIGEHDGGGSSNSEHDDGGPSNSIAALSGASIGEQDGDGSSNSLVVSSDASIGEQDGDGSSNSEHDGGGSSNSIVDISGASIGERNRRRPSFRVGSGVSIGERNRRRPSTRERDRRDHSKNDDGHGDDVKCRQM
ncbi:E3 ubiquitin-protein ligase RING1-like [Daktulosphaira vitifoliae]|uniref:E3 ubiquitin-protein ligase RING1-like n=1 Tax=Daktulosphaira vitifoliae TaxID=58002 RepID=UPI0021A9F58A|nr:E3 ubiquitin-protein ligase RING1-like [Daktulosphaira vitifoliae]